MEGDDDELGNSDCLPRLRAKWSRTYIRLSSYFAHVLIRRGVYSRAAFISLSASNCAAFIRGRRLFEGGVYLRKYGTFCLIVHCHCSLAQITEINQITAWYG